MFENVHQDLGIFESVLECLVVYGSVWEYMKVNACLEMHRG